MASDELSGTRSELLPINKFHVALLGIAGHDLRQPLQAIQNTYDLARLVRSDNASRLCWTTASRL